MNENLAPETDCRGKARYLVQQGFEEDMEQEDKSLATPKQGEDQGEAQANECYFVLGRWLTLDTVGQLSILEGGPLPKTKSPIETVLNEDTRDGPDLLWISTSDLKNARTKKIISSYVMRKVLSERRSRPQALTSLAGSSKGTNRARQAKRTPNPENDSPTATSATRRLTDAEDFDAHLVSSPSCRRDILMRD